MTASNAREAVTPPANSASAHVGVRLGRLPSRDVTRHTAAATRESSPALHVTPTSPRKPFTHEDFSRLDTLAGRLGIALDSTSRKIARFVLEGKPVLSTEGPGHGREIAALVALGLLPQTGLVIGPEVTPLSDLRDRLVRAGIAAALLNDARGPDPERSVLDAIAAGRMKVLLGTPRWFARDPVSRALASVGISGALVLEAHRGSIFSHEFWPSSASVSDVLSRLCSPPVVAFAPAATPAVSHDISDRLMLGTPEVLAGVPVRPNVVLDVRHARGDGRVRTLLDLVREGRRPTLVLCNSSRDVESVYAALRSLHLPAHRYHEELRAGTRAAEQLEFSVPGDKKILVATSAFAISSRLLEEDPEGVSLRFGRRTSKTDIRSLVRFTPPSSLEQLVFELSLLGRDGLPADATVLYDSSDRPAVETEISAARPTGEQLLLFARALEVADRNAAVTTEELALSARTSRRSVESVAGILDGMGLVAHRDGWLRLLALPSTVEREIRQLAERYATVRALDVRRLGEVAELLGQAGCRSQRLDKLLGNSGAVPCGRCRFCRGAETEVTPSALHRQAPARRFTVTPADDSAGTSTFHSDHRPMHGSLTAKIADFR